MEHSFDVEVAKSHGVEKAVILKNLSFWVLKNFANRKHIHDGLCWTYNSQSAFSELFPYMSQQKIGRHLREMEVAGLIKSNNYNKAGYDRTKWYTVPSLFIIQNQTMDCPELNIGLLGSKQPIPDSKPDKKTQIKDLFDSSRIIPVWNSLGCARHKGLTKSAEKALDKTYKEYCKSSETPKELNDWLEAYLKKGFKNWMTDHHRDLDNGQWCADLEFAVRFSTYDKIKNTVKK